MRGVTGISHLLDLVARQKKRPTAWIAVGRSERFLRCAGRESRRETGNVTARRGGTRQRDVTRAPNLVDASVAFKWGVGALIRLHNLGAWCEGDMLGSPGGFHETRLHDAVAGAH